MDGKHDGSKSARPKLKSERKGLLRLRRLLAQESQARNCEGESWEDPPGGIRSHGQLKAKEGWVGHAVMSDERLASGLCHVLVKGVLYRKSAFMKMPTLFNGRLDETLLP
ncbi:unnamed protein product [Ectocarpus sp. 13 AM-2016]